MDLEGAAAPTRPRGPVLEKANRALLRAAAPSSPARAPSLPKLAARQEWPGPNLTRPVSPHFAPRRPSRVVPYRTDVAHSQRPRRTSSQPGTENVFDRLTLPKARVVDASASESKPRGSTVYTGRTIPKEFALSISNHPSYNAGLSRNRASESKFSRTRKPFTDIQNFDPNARTVPAPFDLKSVELHDRARARWQIEQKRVERELDERRKYRALPLRKELLEGPTFVPVLGVPEESVTVPDEDFCTNSDARAATRAQFDMYTAARLDNEAKLMALSNAAREKAEEERRRALWISHAFRARGVPASHYEIDHPPVPSPPYPPTSPHTPGVLRRTLGRRVESEVNTSDVLCYLEDEIGASAVTHESM
jgi:hypothetical protein